MKDVGRFLFWSPNFRSPNVQSGNDDASLSSFVTCNKQWGDSSSSSTGSTQDSSFASRSVDICFALISKESPSLPLREELVSQGFETVRSPRGTALQCAIHESIKKLEANSGFIQKKNRAQKAVTYEAYYKSYTSCRSKRRSENRSKNICDPIDLHRKGCTSSLDRRDGLSVSHKDDDTSASSIYISSSHKDDDISASSIYITPYNTPDLQKKNIKYSSDESEMLLCSGAQKDALSNPLCVTSELCPQNMMSDESSESNRLLNNKTTNSAKNIVYSSASSELTCEQKICDFDERTIPKRSARGSESVHKTVDDEDESNSFSFSYFSALDSSTTETSVPELSINIPKEICDAEESCDGRISLASSSGELMILVRMDFDSSKPESDIEDIDVDSNTISTDRSDAPTDEDSYAFITDFPSFKTNSVSHTDSENTSATHNKQEDHIESWRNSTGAEFELQHFNLKDDSNVPKGVEFNSQHISLEIEHIQQIPDLELDSVTELLDRGSPRSEEKESIYEMLLPCCDHNTTDKTANSAFLLDEQKPGWTKRLLDNLASCCGKFGKKNSQDTYDELENDEGLSYTNSIPYRDDHDKWGTDSDLDMNNFESQHNESSYLSIGDSIFAYTDPGDVIGGAGGGDAIGGDTRYCNQNIELIIPTHILAKQREGCYQTQRPVEELGMESITSFSQWK